MSAAVALSQNEIESLCLKAARGAGFSWGLAEEAGFAAGWLAGVGVDATAALLGLLLTPERPCRMAQLTRGQCRSPDGSALCPISLGATLLDRVRLKDAPTLCETRIDPVASPVLLLPFLARAAQVQASALGIDWHGGQMQIAADGGFAPEAAMLWARADPLGLVLRPSAGSHGLPRSPRSLAPICATTLAALEALALRTTVPASEASRRGAGSATPDTD